ncbi:MAG: hypothetical protein HRT35_38955 [Algicola sp.]|nr:hypothetical protein [Algicola sp.]
MQITTYQGYKSDTFTLRGIFAKLGFVRGATEDGGRFFSYYKDFNSVGIKVCVEFSGSFLPEENVPAVLYHLWFESHSHTDGAGRFGWADSMAIEDVPAVLLAEAMADFAAVAASTDGFYADWARVEPG